MKRIAFFIPHVGCPMQCSFCNQRSISGKQKAPSLKEIREELDRARIVLGDSVLDTEIAFFGGSFTAINRELMENYLQVGKEYHDRYGFRGIRFSTRPDCISDEILTQIESYPIVQIELGAQSMDDLVLAENNRGHTSEDTVTAAKLILGRNIGLTLQMMMGMYGDTAEGTADTARKIAQLSPSEVRIYPTLVLENTELERLYRSGQYIPLNLTEAVESGSELLDFFEENKISVIRMGLHNEDGLTDNVIAGPFHPAFRELCEGYNIYKKTVIMLKSSENARVIFVSPRDISKVKGHGGWLVEKLKKQGFHGIIKGKIGIAQGQVEIE